MESSNVIKVSNEEKDVDNYVLDVKNTIFSNAFMIYGGLIALVYIKIFEDLLNEFTLPEMKLIATLMFAYSFIKIFLALTNSITIQYKPRI